MDYAFEYVLLDRDMVNALIKALHRPEPSGYGTLPGENMNVAWGVHERHTGITVVKASESGPQNARAAKRAGSGSFLFWAVFRLIRIFSKRPKTKKEAPQTGYDVMSREGCFGVCYDADEQGARWILQRSGATATPISLRRNTLTPSSRPSAFMRARA
jgi:hypothetical protein